MIAKENKVAIAIDDTSLKVDKGLTILQAAEQNDIYIPTLCSLKGLAPYGGCRMCIVDVDGMHGFPTACTTPVVEGMVIKTDTEPVREMRMEILQLILSEHTSSCLVCDEKDACKESMNTIRKAGVTTGCRYCPNDSQCDLQDVVEKLGVKEIIYPVYYRGLRVEKEDPFYDRDYNLCILCGRCIRVCQEVRSANTLTFKQRGRRSVIGPAFDRTHLEAGCEFCGACVSVCPTGALSEKARKWDGEADREKITTCALCGVGCQLRLLIKGNKIIGSLPAVDPLITDGQLCVKGRFCITELVNNYHRLKKPQVVQTGTTMEIPWKNAIELAAERLSTCPPERFGMLVSTNCSNEALYVAQKFTRIVMGSHNVDTTARVFYGSAFNAYLDLLKMGIPLSRLCKASVILCVGLDTRYGRSVVGVELRKAMKNGAKIITINPRQHNLSLIADTWFHPEPDEEVALLRSLERLTRKDKKITSRSDAKGKTRGNDGELAEVGRTLKEASLPLILLGSDFLHHEKARRILEMVEKIARNVGAGILPLPAQNNLIGSILMGAYPELVPGGFPSADKKRISEIKKRWGTDIPNPTFKWNAEKLASGKKLNVLYLIGEIPSVSRPPADFLIFQNIYPPHSSYEADLMLPSAAFTEENGTFINGEGRIQRVRKAVDPPGKALPDWEILCRIARKMGFNGFDFSSVGKMQKEISTFVKNFTVSNIRNRKVLSPEFEGEITISRKRRPKAERTEKELPFLLDLSTNKHSYRGFPLSSWVEGARELFPTGKLCMNPEDAEEAGMSNGDEVIITSAYFERALPVKIVSYQQRGMLRVALHEGESIGHSQYLVRIRKKDV